LRTYGTKPSTLALLGSLLVELVLGIGDVGRHGIEIAKAFLTLLEILETWFVILISFTCAVVTPYLCGGPRHDPRTVHRELHQTLPSNQLALNQEEV